MVFLGYNFFHEKMPILICINDPKLNCRINGIILANTQHACEMDPLDCKLQKTCTDCQLVGKTVRGWLTANRIKFKPNNRTA